jgi:AcrR family transcriptional regulator
MAVKRNKRSLATIEAILQAAEKLFAEHGFEAVSLRQIGEGGGFFNKSIVQYYFGDKDSLISAIIESRLSELEHVREQLFSEAEARNLADDPRCLVEMILRPIAEQRNADGVRSYAAFMVALRPSEPWLRHRTHAEPLAPISREIRDRLARAAAHVPAKLFEERVNAAVTMFLTGLVQRDRGRRNLDIEASVIDDMLDAATAIIIRPVAEGVLRDLSASPGA